MRSIADTPTYCRYLTIAYQLPDDEWQSTVSSVNDWLDSNPETITGEQLAEMRATINTPLSATHLACVIYHCYADIPPNYRWDTIFRLNSPANRNETTAISCYGVYWNRAVVNCLDDGHHAVVVINFPNDKPNLIDSLPIGDDGNNFGTLGLCRSEDYHAIQTKLENVG